MDPGHAPGAGHAEGRAGELGGVLGRHIQVQQAQTGDLAQLVQIARHRGQQAGQVGADVGHRERDVDFGPMEHAAMWLTINVGAAQHGLQRGGERLDAGDTGAGAFLELVRLTGQREEGAAGLFAGDDLRHLFGGDRAFDEVVRGELGAGGVLGHRVVS